MLQNAYLLAKIGFDTVSQPASRERACQKFANFCQTILPILLIPSNTYLTPLRYNEGRWLGVREQALESFDKSKVVYLSADGDATRALSLTQGRLYSARFAKVFKKQGTICKLANILATST